MRYSNCVRFCNDQLKYWLWPFQVATRKEEERKYGVFYNDDYNYLKHLRSLDEQGAMVNTQVPSEDEVRKQCYCGSRVAYHSFGNFKIKGKKQLNY